MTLTQEVQLFSRDYINVKSFRTSTRKAKIREVYKVLFGENIKISCNTCYIEALLKIVNNTKMASNKYELKKGVLLQAFGDASKTCTNDTLTDELGDWYLKNCPEKAIYFERMPPSAGVFNPVAPGIRIIPPAPQAGSIIVPPATIPDLKAKIEEEVKVKEVKPEVKVPKRKPSKAKK
jgi:hypothetical protein